MANKVEASKFAKQVKADLDHLTTDSQSDAEKRVRLDRAVEIIKQAIYSNSYQVD